MDWRELAKQSLEIVTGDGKEYKPLFYNGSKQTSFNTEVFEFNDVEGGYAASGAVSYESYPLVLVFQGSDCLDQSKAFLESAKDRKNWRVYHPDYGLIICRPAEFDQDDTNRNVSIIKTTIYETIEIANPRTDETIDLKSKDAIVEGYEAITVLSSSLDVDSSTAADIGDVNTNVSRSVNDGAVSQSDLSKATGLITEAEVALNTIGTEPEIYMNKLSNLLRSPSRFYATISTRLNILDDAFQDLKAALTGSGTVANKSFYEMAGSFTLLAMSETVITPSSEIAEEQEKPDIRAELNTVSDVLNKIAYIEGKYNEYFAELESIQSTYDNKLDSYYPSADVYRILKEALRNVTANLLKIASDAKQERTYILAQDMPVIKLVHYLYGERSKETILAFDEANNIQLNEKILMKKGRKVTYFI